MKKDMIVKTKISYILKYLILFSMIPIHVFKITVILFMTKVYAVGNFICA